MTDYNVDLSDGGVMPKDEEIPTDGVSVLDQLKEELSREIERPDIEIAVPERENVVLRFSPNIAQERLKSWRRNSGENSKRGMDPIKFASYVVGDTCTGIYINGSLVTNSAGVALTFASKEILEIADADTPFEAIQYMFGIDPHLEAAAFTILEHAGYGEEVEAEDPTLPR